MNGHAKQGPVLLKGSREIAAALGLGVGVTQRLLKDPGFPAVRNGNVWLSTRDALQAWANGLHRDGAGNPFDKVSRARKKSK
jgi:hypothetical protein